MNKKILFALLVVSVFTGIHTVHADFTLADWQYSKDIVVPESSTPAYVSVKLDRDVASHSSLFNDLRIVSDSGKEVGYQLVTKQAEVQGGFYNSTLTDLSTQSGQTQFIIDLGQSGQVSNQIQIVTDSKNFKRQVAVYAADSKSPLSSSNWRLLSDKGYIYNFSDIQVGFDAWSGVVTYPKSTARYLKIVIGAGDGSVVVNGAQVYSYEVSGAVEDTYSVPVTAVENKDLKTTELTADLGAQGIPTHSIALQTENKNFNRRVTVQSSTDGKNWNLISQEYMFSISTSLFQGEHLSIDYPETYDRYIRIVVFNDDNEPVAFNLEATLLSYARYVVFEAHPSESYKLYFGNPKAATPHYDLSRFFQYIESTNIPAALLGNVSNNTSYVPPQQPIVPFTEKYPYFLNGILVVLVLGLGGFVFWYIKRMSKNSV